MDLPRERYQHKPKPCGKRRVETADTPLMIAISIDRHETPMQLAYQLTRTVGNIQIIMKGHEALIIEYLMMFCRDRTIRDCINLFDAYMKEGTDYNVAQCKRRRRKEGE